MALIIHRNSLILHFDILENKHEILLNDFNKLTNEVSVIANSFDGLFFNKSNEVQIYIRPPEDGGFLANIFMIVGTAAAFSSFMSTDYPKGFVKGLSGKTVEEWGELHGEKTKEVPAAVRASILARATENFLKQPADKLPKLGLAPTLIVTAFKAKNIFFETCSNNPEIKGLGFTKKHEFPISKKDFTAYIQPIPEEIIDPKEYFTEHKDVEVHSPEWNPNGRAWSAEYDDGKQVFFRISDPNFWQMVRMGTLSPQIKDNMRVQWVKRKGGGKQSAEVLRVLTFNHQAVSTPMTETEIHSWLTDNSKRLMVAKEEDSRQGSLDLVAQQS